MNIKNDIQRQEMAKSRGLKDDFWNNATQGTLIVPNKFERVKIPYRKFPVSRATDVSISSEIANIQGDIPDYHDLPAPIKSFLEEIDQLPDYEKMQSIHKFVNENMEYPDSVEDLYSDDKIVTNAEVVESWRYGDCDNRSQLSAVLMRYSGFSEKDLTMVNGQAHYENQAGEKRGGHSVLIAEINDEHYLLDMNFREAIKITPEGTEHYVAEGLLSAGSLSAVLTFDPELVIPIEKGQRAIVNIEEYKETISNSIKESVLENNAV